MSDHRPYLRAGDLNARIDALTLQINGARRDVERARAHDIVLRSRRLTTVLADAQRKLMAAWEEVNELHEMAERSITDAHEDRRAYQKANAQMLEAVCS